MFTISSYFNIHRSVLTAICVCICFFKLCIYMYVLTQMPHLYFLTGALLGLGSSWVVSGSRCTWTGGSGVTSLLLCVWISSLFCVLLVLTSELFSEFVDSDSSVLDSCVFMCFLYDPDSTYAKNEITMILVKYSTCNCWLSKVNLFE